MGEHVFKDQRLNTVLAAAVVAAMLAPTSAWADRTVHSFVHDRARAHRTLDGHHVVDVTGAAARVFRTPRTRGMDWTVPSMEVSAIHVRWTATGPKPDVRATLDGKVNVPMPKLARGSTDGVVTGKLSTPLPAGEHRVRLSTTHAVVEWIALGPSMLMVRPKRWASK